jgi:aminoglycoside phosphotransferase family enzyme/predicted kinase
MGEGESDQAMVLDFMASPGAYDPAPTQVERIDTHASLVFLAGERAYKIKRAVRYPFLDFSTIELRRRACLNELSINRRTAPHLYLEVMPVTVSDRGEFALGGQGKVVEWVLAMRRFEQANLYDRMAEEGRLPLASMPLLAQTIAAFHRRAERVLAPQQSVSALLAVLQDNEAFAATEGAFSRETLATVKRGSRQALAALEPVFKARALGGYVRHCHGDLHLRNIVEIDGAPVLFDAIEFDDVIATVDVLYDLAFLLMDLGARGLPAYANAVLNAYLDACGGTGNLIGLKALPLFLSMRAMIRAKVESLRAKLGPVLLEREARRRATSYVLLARDYLASRQPGLIAIGGLSGSGKSCVARALAPRLGPFPGAVHVRSDVERKRLFGSSADQPLPESAYAAEVTDIVYRICRKRALMTLEAGQSVIVDGVHAKAEEREAIAACAARAGVEFTGIWLEGPPETMRGRIERRTGDISGATAAVLDQQLTYELGPQSFTVVDASRPLDEVIASCLGVMGQEKPG